MGPIPSRWKGICKSEANFIATIHCNKKIIGARWYIKGFMKEKGLSQSIIDKTYNLSAVDASGHGSTAAGSYVNNLQYYGLNMGTIRGGASLARLAIYKVCWKEMMGVYCSGADILAGVDDAIKDGVDIISASIVSHGISVIAAGGNSGPDSNTISNTSPWVITVAAKPNNQDPMIKLGRSEILEGQEVVLKVPKFSSRGPNAFAPDILKPDIAAPGVNILAAVRPMKGDHGFQLMSGTSMAAPHVSGIVALLKVAYPDWSPAAIKSALVTTAWNEDTYKSEIYSEGAGDKIADPFDFGGGICNPNGATDPGLVYDMDKNDYLNYLCSLGYSNDKMQNATTCYSKTKNSTSSGIICPNKVPSRLDLNLPSISISNLKYPVTIKRTVTNVGNVNAIYKVVIKPPRNTIIQVNPHILKFNSKTKKNSFEVKITSTHQRMSKFTFGSLAWNDGKHLVRIPIAVRKQVDV
ncbi:subtilisin-like protease SBT3.9 [Solanum pennellii]|uniref:Subtilisin-like protease SBT3.9 n=1 Tax=Solanum pennellii TaxID=28526 RepID=A0ABM1HSK9_SOLPN|nr:subtilisin-like protease SBT3.9 [Solanum pennellii]